MKTIRNDILLPAMMAAIVICTFVVFWKLLDVVVVSVSLAVVLYPLYLYCSRIMNRHLSAALVTALVLVLFIAAVLVSILIISDNIGTMEEITGTIQSWAQNPDTDPSIFGFPFGQEQVASWFDRAETLFFSYWDAISSDLSLIALKTVVFFSALYVSLLHGIRIRDHLMSRIPEDIRKHVSMLSAVTVDTLYAIYVVHLGIAALTFIIAIPFFIFLGYGHVLFYAYLCALCELIPVLGSSVFFIFLGIYALSINDIPAILILFFFGYIGVSALPEIYVRPVLMGRHVKIHPFLMLIGFFGGIITMGMAGFVLGPVLIVLLFTSYKIMIEGKKGSGQHPATESP